MASVCALRFTRTKENKNKGGGGRRLSRIGDHDKTNSEGKRSVRVMSSCQVSTLCRISCIASACSQD